jgi:nucleotide-binding universal stress UspA family protein
MIDQANLEDRRIVVGVDSSAGSRTALRWALVQAHMTGAAVEAVTAWQNPVVYDGWVPAGPDSGSLAALAEKVLAETVADVVGTQDRPVDVRTAVAEGPAAQVLLTAAAGAELLVVGSRGRGAFAGMLLGSVSQHCVQHAPCAVVVIPDGDSLPVDRNSTRHRLEQQS